MCGSLRIALKSWGSIALDVTQRFDMPQRHIANAKIEARGRQCRRVAEALTGFYRKYRSLTAHYPIELPEE